ncbi:MAG TPA: ABC transporter permease [Pseudonocardiaceae bacterium]|jgi:ABC-2 type transport system permease protein|nr:ABC transporter permease [Pseudonocardiaceae bacterium]
MTSTMANDLDTLPEPTSPRSWSRATQDMREGLLAWNLWSHLGWQDLRSRYRRSIFGAFWLTIATATTTAGLGILFSALFHDQLSTFLPYIGTGLIIWGFISGCLLDGPDTFAVSDGVIKQVPAPMTVFVLRTVWRQLLTLAHNLIIYVVLLAIFFTHLDHPYTMNTPNCTSGGGLTCQPGLGWYSLLAIPGMVLLVIAMTASTLILGIVAARFRDVKPLIGALVQLLFFFLPISWPLDEFVQKVGGGKAWIIQLNPLFHFVQIVRQPLVGQSVDWWSWLVAIGLTILVWGLALTMLRRYRARISYWV